MNEPRGKSCLADAAEDLRRLSSMMDKGMSTPREIWERERAVRFGPDRDLDRLHREAVLAAMADQKRELLKQDVRTREFNFDARRFLEVDTHEIFELNSVSTPAGAGPSPRGGGSAPQLAEWAKALPTGSPPVEVEMRRRDDLNRVADKAVAARAGVLDEELSKAWRESRRQIGAVAEFEQEHEVKFDYASVAGDIREANRVGAYVDFDGEFSWIDPEGEARETFDLAKERAKVYGAVDPTGILLGQDWETAAASYQSMPVFQEHGGEERLSFAFERAAGELVDHALADWNPEELAANLFRGVDFARLDEHGSLLLGRFLVLTGEGRWDVMCEGWRPDEAEARVLDRVAELWAELPAWFRRPR